jgi:hypothetical protein
LVLFRIGVLFGCYIYYKIDVLLCNKSGGRRGFGRWLWRWRRAVARVQVVWVAWRRRWHRGGRKRRGDAPRREGGEIGDRAFRLFLS